MRSRQRKFGAAPLGRGGCALAAALATALASSPLPATGQSPERPVRTQRHLAVGNVAFVPAWDVTVQGGYLYQLSVRKSRVSVDDLGVTTVTPPRWYAHSLLTAGWADNADGASVTAQLGLLYRFDGPMSISRAGLAVQRSWTPSAWAPVARVGFLNGNVALSVGWALFDDGPDDGVVIGLDMLRCILQDLGLVSRCVIP